MGKDGKEESAQATSQIIADISRVVYQYMVGAGY